MTLGAALSLEALERRHPEWATWLALSGTARTAATDPAWEAALPASAPGDGTTRPLVTGATFTVDARTTVRFVSALLETAGVPALSPEAAVAVLDAAVALDGERLTALAVAGGVDAARLAGLGPLLALPILQACGRTWGGRVDAAWQRAACPVCGAWATLAEARGVEREYRLRCARCGADWPTEPMRCIHCGERHHERLRSLVSEARDDLRRAEICLSCLAYVKTVTTLTACPPLDVGLLDLDTVDLDVAALEHGYGRPSRPAMALETVVVPRRARRFLRRSGRR
jgi:FdhE protein